MTRSSYLRRTQTFAIFRLLVFMILVVVLSTLATQVLFGDPANPLSDLLALGIVYISARVYFHVYVWIPYRLLVTIAKTQPHEINLTNPQKDKSGPKGGQP